MGKDKLLSNPEIWRDNVEDQFGDRRQNAADKEEFEKALENLREFYARVLTWEKLKPEYLKLYKSYFTEAEAKELIIFFRTKAGQKFLLSEGKISWEVNKINKKILEKYEDEHKKLFDTIIRVSGPIKQ